MPLLVNWKHGPLPAGCWVQQVQSGRKPGTCGGMCSLGSPVPLGGALQAAEVNRPGGWDLLKPSLTLPQTRPSVMGHGYFSQGMQQQSMKQQTAQLWGLPEEPMPGRWWDPCSAHPSADPAGPCQAWRLLPSSPAVWLPDIQLQVLCEAGAVGATQLRCCREQCTGRAWLRRDDGWVLFWTMSDGEKMGVPADQGAAGCRQGSSCQMCQTNLNGEPEFYSICTANNINRILFLQAKIMLLLLCLFFMSHLMLAKHSGRLKHDISLHKVSVSRQNLTSGKDYWFEKLCEDQYKWQLLLKWKLTVCFELMKYPY